MADFFDFLNPPAANVQAPTMQNYAPMGMGTADTNMLGGIGNLGQFNMYGQNLGQAQGIAQGMVNDPNAAGFQQGANFASGLGQNAAMNSFGAGGGLYGMGNQVYQTAFDPQRDLYNRTAQQIQDQSRAGQMARGIGMTPYGAGLENQNMRNFNIDWQNQQLQRQLQGLQGVGSAYGQASGMQNAAPGQYLQASAMPYQTSQGIAGNQLGALNQLGQFGQNASAIPQQQIADYGNYLGWGNQANNIANTGANNLFQNQLAQANQGFGQQQQMFGNLGRMAGTLAPMAMGLPPGSFNMFMGQR